MKDHQPAQAFGAMADMDCCLEAEPALDAGGNANLCLVQCTSDAQKADVHLPDVPPAAPGAVLTLDVVPALAQAGPFFLARRPVPPSSPPPTILFGNVRR